MSGKRLPILTVYRCGKQFERFIIQDDERRVWTGEQFGSGRAALFASQSDACFKVHDILKNQFVGIEPKRYVVPCFVGVFSDEPVSEVDVARFLSQATKLSLRTNEFGNGPNNCLVLPVIDWKRIEHIEEFPNG